MKRWLIMLAGVIVLIAVIGGIWGYNLSKKIASFKAMGTPTFTVTTIRAETQTWREQINAVGTLRAVQGADLSNEVAGTVDAIHFESGATVKKGELLAELRAVDDSSKLDSLRATAKLADLNFHRARAQLDANAISKADLDSAEAMATSAKAQVNEQEALVNKKRIRAPFSGKLGIRSIDEGQYVAAGTKFVTLQTLDPIHIDFSVPQQKLSALRVGQTVTAHSDSYPELTFSGSIAAIDPKVDKDTRNVLVRAVLKNPKQQLLPGMYANLTIDAGKPENLITLPITALTYNPYGATAYLAVRENKQAENKDSEKATTDGKTTNANDTLVTKQVFVTPGSKRGDQISILKGLNVGDVVVTSGQLKLKNGSRIAVNNSVQPAFDPNPHPSEE
ncbi:MAG: efflux transporter periplasmic adaptor subunit [Verrucomicrobiaceae bacterium]|nr:efflux transporter periplasmic adaptor subunit [Verrucomicrobiaceae bacterium]